MIVTGQREYDHCGAHLHMKLSSITELPYISPPCTSVTIPMKTRQYHMSDKTRLKGAT